MPILPCRPVFLVAILVPILFGALAPRPADAESAIERDRIASALEKVLDRGDYQTDLSDAEPLPELELPSEPPPRFLLDVFKGFGTLAELLLWGTAILGAGGLLFLLAREMNARLAQRAQAAAPGGAKPEETIANAGPKRLDDADALAQSGAFSDAIHLLLLVLLEELRRGLDLFLAPSLTSREVLRRVSLPDEAEHALSRLVRAVELSQFGGHAATATDYDRCRGWFESVTEAAQSGGTGR